MPTEPVSRVGGSRVGDGKVGRVGDTVVIRKIRFMLATYSITSECGAVEV